MLVRLRSPTTSNELPVKMRMVSSFGSVVDNILADKFQVAVGIAAVETQLALGQSDAQMIRLGVLELFHHPHFGIGLRAITLVLADLLHVVVAVLLHLRSVVDVKPQRVNAGGAHELNLLGFLVA